MPLCMTLKQNTCCHVCTERRSEEQVGSRDHNDDLVYMKGPLTEDAVNRILASRFSQSQRSVWKFFYVIITRIHQEQMKEQSISIRLHKNIKMASCVAIDTAGTPDYRAAEHVSWHPSPGAHVHIWWTTRWRTQTVCWRRSDVISRDTLSPGLRRWVSVAQE